MTEVQQFILSLIAGVLILGRLVSRWSAHHKIQQTIQRDGAAITGIRRFDGFLDLGSVWAAIISTGYTVTIVASDGRKSDILCVVRHIPIVGLARSVENYPDESEVTRL